MKEIDLVRGAQGGDRDALNKLLTDNYSILKGYILKMTANPSLAQDITQETMLKAVLNIKKFDPRAKFSTYLITIGTNLYRDYLRKNKNTAPLEDDVESSENLEDQSINDLRYKEVLNILAGLPYEKRAVFILKHYYGYSYEEIADMLKCPVGTVRSRLHNCIEIIKKEMERRKLI